MLVVYTDVYLTKLWTMYEIACFCALRPTSKLTIVLLTTPVLIISAGTISYATYVVGAILVVFTEVVADIAFVVSGLLKWYFCVVALRHLSCRKKAVLAHMLSFRVEDCTCFCEEDRPTVYGNISLLMRHLGLASADRCHRRAGTRSFQQDRTSRVAQSHDRVNGPFRHQVWVIILATPIESIVEHDSATDVGIRARICVTMHLLVFVLGIVPLQVALFAWCCGAKLHIKGWREWALMALGATLMLGLWGVARSWFRRLLKVAFREDLGMAAQALLLAFLIGGRTCLFSRELPSRLAGFWARWGDA